MLLKKDKKEVLGLHIEGDQLLVAHVRRDGEQTVLAGLGSATLSDLAELVGEDPGEDEAAEIPEATMQPGLEHNVLGLDEEEQEPTTIEAEEDVPSNEEAVYELLKRFPIRKCKCALSLLEERVFFTEFKGSFNLKGKKLKKKLIEETAREAQSSIPAVERHGYFQTKHGSLVSIMHEDQLGLIQILDRLEPFIGLAHIDLIDTLETTLMDVTKKMYPSTSDLTAIIYIGDEFSRILFMRDGEWTSLAQAIHEGGTTPGIMQTICSRIFLEQDLLSLPAIDHIVIACKAHLNDSFDVIKAQFPDVDIHKLAYGGFDISELDEQEVSMIPSFAVPIGLAWKALNQRDKSLFQINFLTRARKKKQRSNEIVWHSLAHLLFVGSGVLYLVLGAQNNARDVGRIEYEVRVLQEQIEVARSLADSIYVVNDQIMALEKDFVLIDSLGMQRVMMGDGLGRIAEAAETTGGVWLERAATSLQSLNMVEGNAVLGGAGEDRLYLIGKALNLDEVAELANHFADKHIGTVQGTEIRDRTVFDFSMEVSINGAGAGM